MTTVQFEKGLLHTKSLQATCFFLTYFLFAFFCSPSWPAIRPPHDYLCFLQGNSSELFLGHFLLTSFFSFCSCSFSFFSSVFFFPFVSPSTLASKTDRLFEIDSGLLPTGSPSWPVIRPPPDYLGFLRENKGLILYETRSSPRISRGKAGISIGKAAAI